jgi:uncharacterized membrane protein YdjX (TVP38/TMEM64 family)
MEDARMRESTAVASGENRAENAEKTGGFPVGKFLIGIVVLAALLVLAVQRDQVSAYLLRFPEFVENAGFWGPLAFIGVYTVAVVAFVPASALTIAGGAIFGLAKGTAYVFVAAILGSGAAFLVARYLARRPIERRLQDNPRFAAIDRAVGHEGRKIVFLLRLSPVFPFNLLNYGLGLTRVRFVDYMVAGLGMLPGTLLYVYSGNVAGEVAAAAAGGTEKGLAEYAVLIVGLLATLAVTVVVTRIARRALKEVTDA